MGMVVQHNMNALNAYNKLNTNVAGLKKSSEKLSSGYRINRAGDDAAGLAISEKMRSQIRGLNQAKRNSQDGISMIQTFEGATQESHSILQRMKELASESANGTYQDEVDRDAIQLEFNQLNDELDQIADTDFNGVVMLNGGEMADGTKAVNGKFDYANNARTAKQLSAADINKLDSQSMDNSTSKTNNYDMADAFWKDLGFDRNDADTTNNGPDSIDITFKYDSTKQTWTAISATGGADKDAVLVSTHPNNGGFQIGSKSSTGALTDADGKPSADNLVNVVLDGTQLVNGDTITITFKNPSAKNTAIENIGVANADASGLTVGKPGAGKTVIGKDADLKVEIENGVIESTNNGKATAMTEGTKALFDALNGATVTTTYAADNTADATMSLKLTDENTTTIGAAALTAGQKFSLKGEEFYAKCENGVTTIYAGADDTGTALVKLTAANGATENTNGSTGDIKYTLAVDTAKYATDGVPTAEVASPANVVSKANSNNKATAPLTYSDHMVLQTGSRTKDSVDFTFKYSTDGMGDLKSNLDLSSRANGLNTKNLSLSTQEDANTAIDKIDNAINKVSMVRATFGATQNRLEHKIENLTTNSENLTEAESTIRDTDMASEMLNYTKFNVLQQAAQSMLAQANQQPQSILQLLG